MKRIIKILKKNKVAKFFRKSSTKAFKVFLVFALVTSWTLSGWPKLGFKINNQEFSFPPKIEESKATFSAVTASGSAIEQTSDTSISVSPSANVTVGKILFAAAVSDNAATVDGPSTLHSIADSQSNTWTKVYEETETDGAADDGSTSSLWWTKVTTQIGTGDSVTLTLGSARTAKIITIVEVTITAGNTLASTSGYTGNTHAASGTSLSHTLSGLTSREYLFFGHFGAEGNDQAKTPIANYTEHYDLRTVNNSGTSVENHVATRILTGTGDTWTSSAATFTSGVQSLTAFYEITPTTFTQTAFRIRSDDSQTLNADAGWAAAVNTNASIGPDLEFRIRLEVEASATETQAFELWYSRDGAAYAIVPDNNAGGVGHAHNEAASDDGQKTVQVILSTQYADAATTTDVLTGAGTSSATFVTGSGNEDNTTPSVSFSGNSHTEIEYAVLMRKLYDSKGHNPDGTTFAFRLRKSGGTVLDTYTNTPTVTVLNRPGHIGGSVIETPMRYHVKDGNGNLYYLSEYADTSNTAVMMKSTNGGGAWNPVDVTGEPTDNDLEAGDMDLRGNTIGIAIQSNDTPVYWRYNVSTHGTPDDWLASETVTTGITPEQQCIAIAERSATTVMAYCGAPVGADQKVYYKIRSGTWGSENNLDSTSGVDVQGVGAIRDSTDKIHFVYTGYDGTSYKIYLRSLSTSDVLGTIRTIADTGITTQALSARVSHTPPITWTDGTTEKVGVAYRKSGDLLYFRSWNASTESFDTEETVSGNVIEFSEGGNNILLADVVVDDATDKLHAIYSEGTGSPSTYDIWYDTRQGGSWGTDTEEQDAVQASWIRGLLFTHSSGNGGNKVVGYIWDNSDPDHTPFTQPGGTGFTEYDEKIIRTFTQNDFEWFEDQATVSFTQPDHVWPSTITTQELAENEVFTQLPASRKPLVPEDKIRIQINATIGGVNLGAAAEDFKLQYVAGEDCTVTTGWADVGAKASGTIWRFFDNTSLTDTATEANQISTSDVAGGYSEVNPSGTNPNAVTAGQDVEWDFAVENNGAATNTTYCFRMIVNTGTGQIYDTYNADSFPKLTTAPGTDVLMRHGNFFQNDSEKGFFWAD